MRVIIRKVIVSLWIEEEATKLNKYLSRLFRGLGGFLALCILVVLLLSLSSKESVRVRILLDGHPVTAIKCDPKYTKVQSRAIHQPVYTIPYKNGYDSNDEFLTGKEEIV